MHKYSFSELGSMPSFLGMLEDVRKRLLEELDKRGVKYYPDFTSLVSPFPPHHWKASHGDVLVTIDPSYQERVNGPSACLIVVLNTNRREVERLRRETGLWFERASYEPEDKEVFDAEVFVPCDAKLMAELFEKVVKAKYGSTR